ncbi:Uncharacterized conserved protein YprB, contains RNaseH-like and TPR domains [Geoalkalibacter ferrihydriticus]|uniref:Uncharacterized conserved protein YprB, contains RNaseH-like and TPR domains n=1 Tax=Geoalkalibacter ferrihydriticus TaxID=392333 RepID=A0A1G9LYF2_9BACT|nr:ribonuclease H-like domain-containing protein [Geoalkalibacter ferrihydriticus]SDL66904.1 Uncharacterized conserved protein YprB, contains RNaseH-like and TPR domains [Geoalkalibacter ferrihydriticus]
MLQYTFRHLKGFGAKKEAELWRAYTFTWDDFENAYNSQLSLFEHTASFLQESRLALEAGDVEYFATSLPHQEHFRIALTYPEDTMFLDIETTGLSKYYDKITLIGWSIGTEYGVYLQGDDDSEFRKALSSAKAIVTFNGSIFDLPFIRNEFEDIRFPACHVDLRFMSKRAGFSGGQKVIEEQLGLKRSAKAAEVDGLKATLLWHKYKWGDEKALRQLIVYNHADVEGMKVIFDKVAKILLKNYQLPTSKITLPKFAKRRSKINWANKKTDKPDGIVIRPYGGKIGPLVFLDELALPKQQGLRVVGIDLTGSEGRPSGWCFLNHDLAETKCLGPDEDLINETLKVKPDLVSIDSPLSIPFGRTSVDDSDPGRHEFGIMRKCERLLKKRGVNVYPSLIPSMQQLTARGMRLAERFRKLGVPVIESYPGAAQDIMGIPRKGASLDYLSKGLELFGVKGNYLTEQVCHDELDAITSAVVGLFFWSGKFEAIGNEEEDYLIIPDLEVDTTNWLERKVIGLSGPIATGKTTAAKFIEEAGFAYGRFSQILKQMLIDRGEDVNRETLQEIGEKVNKTPGQRWLCTQLLKMLPEQGKLVIDGLRHPEDHAFMIESFGPAFMHAHIESSESVRTTRYVADGHSVEEFKVACNHPAEKDISKLALLAHRTIRNNGDLKSLQSSVDEIAQ